MDKAHLLRGTYNDSDSEDFSSENLSSEDLAIPSKTSSFRHRFATGRLVLEFITVCCLGVLVWLVLHKQEPASRPECVQHHLPVGSDLSGFVPSDISSRPTLWSSGPDEYSFSGDSFDDLTVFNQTVKSWKPLTNAFVKASPYDGRGPQVPFVTGGDELFVVSGLHDLHCLTALLENFGMLQAGFSRAQLEAAYGGKYLTWPGHIAHCFNRVRQSLMCHADSAVEGHIDGNERLITHDGVLHICNDFNALKNWAEEPERRLPENLKPVN